MRLANSPVKIAIVKLIKVPINTYSESNRALSSLFTEIRRIDLAAIKNPMA